VSGCHLWYSIIVPPGAVQQAHRARVCGTHAVEWRTLPDSIICAPRRWSAQWADRTVSYAGRKGSRTAVRTVLYSAVRPTAVRLPACAASGAPCTIAARSPSGASYPSTARGRPVPGYDDPCSAARYSTRR